MDRHNEAYDNGYSQGWRQNNSQTNRFGPNPKAARSGQDGFRRNAANETSRPLEKPLDVGHSCTLCDGVHEVMYCGKFKNLPVGERKAIIANRGLCVIWLKKGHGRTKCPTNVKCKVAGCKGTHHSTLHVYQA